MIGLLSSDDQDANATHSYDLVGGQGSGDNGLFQVSGGRLEVKASTTLDFENRDQYAVRLRTTDNGGLQHEQPFMVHVSDVNETPTDLALSNTTLNENTDTTSDVLIGLLTTLDVDAGATHSYSLVAGQGADDNGSFKINGGQLLVKAGTTLDFENQSSYSLRLRTTDNGSLSYDEPLTINLLDVNESPTDLTLSNDAIDENTSTASQVLIGNLASVDQDAGATHTYSLVGGVGSDDNGSFDIDGDKLLVRAGTTLDHEAQASYAVRVRATDNGGLTFDQALQIAVVDVNEPASDIVISNDNIDENVDTANAVAIGQLSAVDQDAGSAHVFTLVAGSGAADNAKFQITGENLNIKADTNVDFENQSSYEVRLRATDAGGLSYETPLTIDVNDINEGPTEFALSSNTIEENTDTTNAVLIGLLSVADQDSGASHTFELVAGSGATDNDSFQISGQRLEVQPESLLDFETLPSYSVRVRATDDGGLLVEKPLTINVIDVNDPPTGVQLSNSAVPEDSDTTQALQIGLLTADDQDVAQTHTFAFAGGIGATDNSFFQIQDDKLQFRPGVVLNHEAKSTYEVRVEAEDPAGQAAEQELVIDITNVNERPFAIALDPDSVDENSAGGVVGSLTVFDFDDGDTHTLAVDDVRFEVVNEQLKLKPGVMLDHEQEATVRVAVTATDAGSPGLQLTRDFIVKVNDLNESPSVAVAIADQTTEAAVPFSFTIPGNSFVDLDRNDTLTFVAELADGSDLPSWLSFTSSTRTFAGIPAIDEVSSFDITVTATDSGQTGLTASDTFQLEVTERTFPWNNSRDARETSTTTAVCLLLTSCW